MPTARSRTFRSGNSEAVRLPREVAFGVDVPVTIVKSGDVMTIYPTRPPIGEMIKRLLALPGPGEIEVRDEEPLPGTARPLGVAYMLDTNIAIHLRDRDVAITLKTGALEGPVLLSVISRVELEGGVHRDPARSALRRTRLDLMLTTLPILAFDEAAAHAYRGIVEIAGYSRRKLIGRMIAAQALVHQATLVTCNGDDFRDIPGLRLLEW